MAEIVMIHIDHLFPHPDNPRKDLGDLTELADSIRAKGVLQNLTVIPSLTNNEHYIILIGHRRHAAAKLAGLKELPCAIVEMSYEDQLATMLPWRRINRAVCLPAARFRSGRHCALYSWAGNS